MARLSSTSLAVAALASAMALSACGAPMSKLPVRGTLSGEKAMMTAKNSVADATPEVIVVTDGENAVAPALVGGKRIDSMSFKGKTYHLFDVGQKSLISRVLDAARSTPGVRAADANLALYALGAPINGEVPDDEFYGLQFGLVQKNLPLAWKTTAGDPNMIVGVVDTGIDYSHPDLKGKVVLGPDLTFKPGLILNRKDPNGPMDDNGHGTHCAGIIAATANNGVGIAGVAPNVKVMAVKSLNAAGGGSSWGVMTGVKAAVLNGAKIVSMSLGGTSTNSAERTFYQAIVDSGILIVAAAGNSADAVGFPAAYPGVLSVGATDSGGGLAKFSNHDQSMSVTAPGVGILSTVPGQSYAKMSGTSMAAPFVSGVAALVWSHHPDWTAAQVKEQIERTAKDMGAPGVDPVFGYGEVDVLAALGHP